MGKMRQFRRAIRNSVGKPLLFHARDGYGAVLRGLHQSLLGLANGWHPYPP